MSARPPGAGTPRGERRNVGPRYVVVAVSLGSILAPLNSTMLAVALPVIRKDLEISHAAAGWLISSYLIAMAVTQPAGGRLGDAIGHARVFRGALAAFLVFSLAASVAPDFRTLLLFRTLQAVSGALLMPNARAMLREAVPAGQLGRFSGWNAASIGAAAAFGPLLGGVVLAVADWRYLFLVNVPFVALGLFMALRLQNYPSANSRTGRPDLAGTVLFGLLLCLVTVVLNRLGSGGFGAQSAVAAALVVVLATFAWRQAHTSSPAAEWGLFRIASFAGASAHILLMNLAMYTTLVATPFFLTEVQHRGTLLAGLLVGGLAGFQVIGAPVAGRISDAAGRRMTMIGSSIAGLSAAVMLIAGIDEGMSPAYLAVALAILGLGYGFGFVSAEVAAVEAVPKALTASAAGTQSMMRYIGSIIGVGLLSGVLTTGADGPPEITAFRLLYILMAGLVALSVPAAMLVRPPTEHSPAIRDEGR